MPYACACERLPTLRRRSSCRSGGSSASGRDVPFRPFNFTSTLQTSAVMLHTSCLPLKHLELTVYKLPGRSASMPRRNDWKYLVALKSLTTMALARFLAALRPLRTPLRPLSSSLVYQRKSALRMAIWNVPQGPVLHNSAAHSEPLKRRASWRASYRRLGGRER